MRGWGITPLIVDALAESEAETAGTGMRRAYQRAMEN